MYTDIAAAYAAETQRRADRIADRELAEEAADLAEAEAGRPAARWPRRPVRVDHMMADPWTGIPEGNQWMYGPD